MKTHPIISMLVLWAVNVLPLQAASHKGGGGTLTPTHNTTKRGAYTIETVGDTWVQFKVQYYIFALVFVVFDVETIFLFPFAAAYGQVGLFAVFEVIFFILVLAGGLFYAWRKGALEWA